MRSWIGRVVCTVLVVVGIVGGVGVTLKSAAAAAGPPPPAHVVGREGEVSPSLPQSETGEKVIYLPFIVPSWPPVPPAPALTAPGLLPVTATYTLTWSLPESAPPPDRYQVEEAQSPDFAGAKVYTTTAATLTFTDTLPGYYHYRVRGMNGSVTGPWSNQETVSLVVLQDSFEDRIAHWTARRTSAPDISIMTFTYRDDGTAQTMVADKFDFAIFSPLAPAPARPYSIKLTSRIIHKVNLVSYGLVWGGEPGVFCEVQRVQAGRTDGCFSHYYRLNVVWAGNYLKYEIKRIDYHDPSDGKGKGESLVGWGNLSGYHWDPADWHDWEVRVYDDYFEVSVNGELLHVVEDDSYLSNPLYGIFSSTNEYNYAHFEHDYFGVAPLE